MHGMACCTVDDGRVGHVFSIVNEDGPDVDKDEQRNIGELLERENEGKKMVRHRLQETVYGMEGMGREWSGHDPLVMCLVEGLVDSRMM